MTKWRKWRKKMKIIKRTLPFVILVMILFLISSNSAYTSESNREEERIINSLEILQDMVTKEDQAETIERLLSTAHGIAIFPKLTKIGLGIGVQFGEGIVLRKDQKDDNWYGPAFIEIKTASIGPQIGIQDVSLILIIMDENGINGFKKTDFEIGANISISPGSTRETLQKSADFNDSIYTYAYSEGLYAGFTLEGSVIHADRNANKSFYGTNLTNEEILENQKSENNAVLKLLLEIEKVSK